MIAGTIAMIGRSNDAVGVLESRCDPESMGATTSPDEVWRAATTLSASGKRRFTRLLRSRSEESRRIGHRGKRQAEKSDCRGCERRKRSAAQKLGHGFADQRL